MDIFDKEIADIVDQLNNLTAVKPHKLPPDPEEFTRTLRDHKGRYTEEQATLALLNIVPKHIVRYLVEHHLGYIHSLGKQGLAQGDQ